MNKLKHVLVNTFILTTLFSCTIFHTGCKKTTDETKVYHKEPDGTTVKDSAKTEQSDNGSTKTTTEHKVDH